MLRQGMSHKVDLTNNKRRKVSHDSSSEEEPPADVAVVTAEDIYERVMAIAEKNAASKNFL